MAENAFGDLRIPQSGRLTRSTTLGIRPKRPAMTSTGWETRLQEVDGVLDLIKESAQFAHAKALQAMAENGIGAQRLMGSLEDSTGPSADRGRTPAQQNMENMANVIDDGDSSDQCDGKTPRTMPTTSSTSGTPSRQLVFWRSSAAAERNDPHSAGRPAESGTGRAAGSEGEGRSRCHEGIAAATAKATDASTQALDVEKVN